MATTRFADMDSPLGRKPSTTSRARIRWIAFGLFVALFAFAVMACGTALAADPTPNPAASAAATSAQGSPAVTPSQAASPAAAVTPEPQPLRPASPAADPLAFVAWLMTPIFQGLFILLAGLYALTGNIVVAIMLMTLMIRVLTVRLSARQIVSQIAHADGSPLSIKALPGRDQAPLPGDRQATMAANQEATAGLLQGTRRQPHGRLPALAAPDGPSLPDVLGHQRRSDQLRPERRCWRSSESTWCRPSSASNAVDGVVDKAHPCINTIVSGIDWASPRFSSACRCRFSALSASAHSRWSPRCCSSSRAGC